MVAASKIAFFALGASIAQATTCPSGQQLIANNKCCPGFAIISGVNDSVCCVLDSNSSCKGVGICGDGTTSSCKAKVGTTDPDYDQKVQDALSGTSSSSASGSATPTPTASSASSTASSDSSSDSGSSTSGTKKGAAEANKAMLGMVVAIAAVPVAFYGL
ncbi:uncharacterized protein GGS22DRAFT_185259 [Annulohypoxylon maeteangense]|uniref:uncharacterized protein n=1 Tax=Annulohypoxylon maeteangense TaxID=1927788 RepID=UPI0020084A31|nr:uncharacterized protein GGS22DRAFT_185259 [Annulohypoxylon maeteangense]KAI0887878.1 hypothetical protein GGS22DRAFT_185259 [Annulohypoxylon maeteangense]